MLVLLQLGDKFKVGKKKASAALAVALRVAGAIAMSAVFFGLFSIFKNFFSIPITRDFLFFFVIIIVILNIIGLMVSMINGLYGSKDNPILLSLPSAHAEVYYSKLIVFYISEFLKNLNIIFPLTIAFGFINRGSVVYYLMCLLLAFIIPLVCVLIGSLLSIPLMYIIKLFKKIPLIPVVLIIGACVGVAFGINYIGSILPSTIRLKAMYTSIVIALDKATIALVNHSLFFIWFKSILFTSKGIHFLYVFLLIAGLLGLNILLSRPLFFSLASSSLESARQKDHKSKKEKPVSTYGAFLKKEFILSIRNIGELFEEYALVIVLPFMLYFVNTFFNRLSMTPLGEYMTLAFNIIIGLLFITASNQSSATALSKEGAEFVLLKTAPSNTKLICWAKITMNILISTLFMLVSLIVLLIIGIVNIKTLFFMFGVFFICNIVHILWSLQLDIKNPLMREYASTGGAKDNKNLSKGLLNGLLIAIIAGALTLILKYVLHGSILASVLVLVLLLVFAGVRFYLFKLNLECLFQDIEY